MLAESALVVVEVALQPSLTALSSSAVLVFVDAQHAPTNNHRVIREQRGVAHTRKICQRRGSSQLGGLIIINCRDFAVTSVSLLNAHPETCDKLCEIAVGFPVAFMLHIWGDPASRADSFATMCEGVFDAPTMDALKAAKSRPLFLIERAQRIILDHYRRESLVLDPHRAVLESRVYNSLINTARGLGCRSAAVSVYRARRSHSRTLRTCGPFCY